MPKINQEEYEILKEIRRNGFEEIRRNSTGDIGVRVIGEKVTSHQYLTEHNDKFNFLKATGDYWSIAELIEEYERESHIKQVLEFYEEGFRYVREAFIKLSKAFGEESEETEVKDIEWLKEHITIILGGKVKYKDKNVVDDKYFVGLNNAYVAVLEMLESLDVETLTPEWIDELIHYSTDQDALGNIVRIEMVPAKYLRNLLVPKLTHEQVEEYLQSKDMVAVDCQYLNTIASDEQEMNVNDLAYFITKVESEGLIVTEKPVIPQFVANWIESKKNFELSVFHALDMIAPDGKKLSMWLWGENNADVFARAWLDGFTVEEEQRYYVIFKQEDTCTVTLNENGGIGTIFRTGSEIPKSYQLTEQEIKDYDERFWPFAVKVEELEG